MQNNKNVRKTNYNFTNNRVRRKINKVKRFNKRKRQLNNQRDQNILNQLNLNRRVTIEDIRRGNKILDRKINNITNKLSKIKINKKTKKEIRNDKITNAANMAITDRFLSLFPTSNRITYQKIYNRYTIESDDNGATIKLLWFPYAVNFSSYPDINITVFTTEDKIPNMIANLIWTKNDTSILPNAFKPFNSTPCGIPGVYRLICATLQMKTVTSPMTRSGSYIIYKLNQNELCPPFYNSEEDINHISAQNYFSKVSSIVSKNHDQILIKHAYANNEIATINEFNIYEGNNIFQDYKEYLGTEYMTSTEAIADWKDNPSGNNIKYQIDIPPTPYTNTYMIETWQIIEVVPHPSLGLDNIAHIQSKLASKQLLNKLRVYNPFKSRIIKD